MLYSLNIIFIMFNFKAKHAVAVALNGDILKAMASPASVNLSGAWRVEGGQGFFRQGYNRGGAFAPLYALKKLAIPKRRRYESSGSPLDEKEYGISSRIRVPLITN